MRRIALLCLVLAIGGAGAEQVQVQQMPDPSPGSIGLRGEQRYSLTRGDLTAVLSYVPTSQTLMLRMQGRSPPVPLAEQAALLEPLLSRFLQDHPKPPRVVLLLQDHGQIVTRLAAVLESCTNWDGKAGRPVQGALGQFLVDTLNSHDLAAEIAAVFVDKGYRFAAEGAAMISEERVAEVTHRLVPTDIGYLSFVADLSPGSGGNTTWPTQSRRSTC
jgi:hypothetical protein